MRKSQHHRTMAAVKNALFRNCTKTTSCQQNDGRQLCGLLHPVPHRHIPVSYQEYTIFLLDSPQYNRIDLVALSNSVSSVHHRVNMTFDMRKTHVFLKQSTLIRQRILPRICTCFTVDNPFRIDNMAGIIHKLALQHYILIHYILVNK